MKFSEALKLLQQGIPIISKRDKESHDQQVLRLHEDGRIIYMNELWTPTPQWLLEYMDDEWINVEEDCDYHDCDNPESKCKIKDSAL